jgi:hypothetical protein
MRKFFFQGSDGTVALGVPKATRDEPTIFTDYIAHTLSESVVPAPSLQSISIKTEGPEGLSGQRTVEGDQHLPSYRIDHSRLGVVSPDEAAYLQDLFYVTRGHLPFVAPDSVRNELRSLHGLISFNGDLQLSWKGTPVDTDLEGNQTETDVQLNTISAEELQSYQATTSNLNYVMYGSEDAPSFARASLYTLNTSAVNGTIAALANSHYGGVNGDTFIPRMAFVSAGTNTVLAEWDYTTNTVREIFSAPTAPGAAIDFGLETNGKYALFFTNLSGAVLINMETGEQITVQNSFLGQRFIGMCPINANGIPSFLLATADTNFLTGSLNVVNAVGDVYNLQTGTEGMPTALMASPSNPTQAMVIRRGSTLNSYTAYQVDFSTQFKQPTQVLESTTIPGADARNWEITQIFGIGRETWGIARVIEAGETFSPILVNLVTNQGFVSAETFTNDQSTCADQTARTADGTYIRLDGGALNPFADFTNTISTLPHINSIANYDQIYAVQNIFHVVPTESLGYSLVGSTHLDLQGINPTHMISVQGRLAIAPLSSSAQTDRLVVFDVNLPKHNSVGPAFAVRSHTGKPYPSPLRTLDATAQGAGNTIIEWPSGDRGDVDFPQSTAGLVDFGIVDYVVRNEQIYGVGLAYPSSTEDSNGTMSYLVPYVQRGDSAGPTPYRPTAAPTLLLHTVPPLNFQVTSGATTYVGWEIDRLLNSESELDLKIARRSTSGYVPDRKRFSTYTTGFDVGFALETLSPDLSTIEIVEWFTPSVEIDPVEIGGDYSPSNTTVKGLRASTFSPGDLACIASGQGGGNTPYAQTDLSPTDILRLTQGYFSASSPFEPTCRPPVFYNEIVSAEVDNNNTYESTIVMGIRAETDPEPTTVFGQSFVDYFNDSGDDFASNAAPIPNPFGDNRNSDFLQMSGDFDLDEDLGVYLEIPLLAHVSSESGPFDPDDYDWSVSVRQKQANSLTLFGTMAFAFRQGDNIFVATGGNDIQQLGPTGLGNETYDTYTTAGSGLVRLATPQSWLSPGAQTIYGPLEYGDTTVAYNPNAPMTHFGIIMVRRAVNGNDNVFMQFYIRDLRVTRIDGQPTIMQLSFVRLFRGIFGDCPPGFDPVDEGTGNPSFVGTPAIADPEPQLTRQGYFSTNSINSFGEPLIIVPTFSSFTVTGSYAAGQTTFTNWFDVNRSSVISDTDLTIDAKADFTLTSMRLNSTTTNCQMSGPVN